MINLNIFNSSKIKMVKTNELIAQTKINGFPHSKNELKRKLTTFVYYTL